MEDKQKVYLKGDSERGNEVIKILEDLGGYNSYSLDGHNSNNYYFIAPDGIINNINVSSLVFSFVKAFYKEIKLQEWKSEFDDNWYFINANGEVIKGTWNNNQIDNSCLEFGNCFSTFKEAEAARDKIKKILKRKN